MAHRRRAVRHPDVDRSVFRDDADDAAGDEEVPGGREAIRKSLAELGPMKAAEKKLLAISLTLIGFWATEGVLHRFDTSSTTIAAVALMFLPGIGIMTWKEAQPKIPWGTIVLFGIGISLGTALLQTKGAAGWRTSWWRSSASRTRPHSSSSA